MKGSSGKFIGATLGLIAGLAVVVGVYGLVLEDRKGDPADNPCYRLSDGECESLISQSRTDFETRWQEWIIPYNRGDVDVRALPQSFVNASYNEPQRDLNAAVKAADVIVSGSAKAIEFTNPGNAAVTFTVAESIKGAPGMEMIIIQSGGPDPVANWEKAVLGIAEAAPLLLPGDEALLLLVKDQSGKNYVQIWTGYYLVGIDGKVTALEGNPFAASVDGRSLEEFKATVQAAVSEQASAP